MLAGTLARAGWFVGERPYTPRASNPKGFFESPEINGINEYLLARVLPAGEGSGDWQRWLALLDPDVECTADARAEERIRSAVSRSPWCFKDPRLCYTLPAWRSQLGDAAYLCVFRHPAITAQSILKECRDESYLQGLSIDRDKALEVWLRLYRRVLDQHRQQGDWLFLDYEQVFTSEGLSRVERAVGAPISRDFPDRVLRRTQSDEAVPREVARTYAELCELAGFDAGDVKTCVAKPEIVASTPLERVCTAVAIERGWTAIAPELHELVSAQRNETRSAAEALIAGVRSPASLPAWMSASREECEDYVVQRLPRIPTWERSLAGLARLEVDALQRIGQAQAAAAILTTLHETVGELLAVHAREELVRVLDRYGANQLSDVVDAMPWTIASNARRRVLAWPTWNEAELARMWRDFGPTIAGRSDVALCLRFDPAVDGPWAEAERRLALSYERELPHQPAIEVIVLNEPIPAPALRRLGLAVDCALSLCDGEVVRARWMSALQVPSASSASELETCLAQTRVRV
jgi:hypothetical protein